MITQLKIKNFKSLQDVTLDCRNLNILTGINGMGKSSIIQVLLLLRQSYLKEYFKGKEKYLFLGENIENDLVVIGDYEDAIYRDFLIKEPFIRFNVALQDKNLSIKTLDYQTQNNDNAKIKNTDAPLSRLLLNKSDLKQTVFAESLFIKKHFQYIKADRTANIDTLPTDNKRVEEKDFGIDGRYATHYFLENANQPLSIKTLLMPEEQDILSYQVNAWLSYISPNIKVASDYNPKNPSIIDQQYSFSTDGLPRKPFKASNVGFGISYTFAVVLALLTAETGDLIIIENPEAHLHPKGQSKLAELICLAAQAGVQIFCETHSDHIVNGTLVNIYEHSKDKNKGISHENVNISFFRKKEREVVSEIVNVEVSETGRFKQPKQASFFDQIGIDVSRLSKR